MDKAVNKAGSQNRRALPNRNVALPLRSYLEGTKARNEKEERHAIGLIQQDKGSRKVTAAKGTRNVIRDYQYGEKDLDVVKKVESWRRWVIL